jgi:NMD protein affecting ribosome stability and mRNA decay
MQVILREGDVVTFEYTILIQVAHLGRNIDLEQNALEGQKRDILTKIATRVNEFYDDIILMGG